VRVTSGEHRNRTLVAPPGETTRPTTDKVRLAIFNSLASTIALDGAIVVDLFAGSGALGIEALSRGAARCTFVERDRDALVALRTNIAALGLDDRSTVVSSDALAWAPAIRSVDVLLADPPYGFEAWDRLLATATAGVAVIESDAVVEPPSGWRAVRSRRYGRTWVTTLERLG